LSINENSTGVTYLVWFESHGKEKSSTPVSIFKLLVLQRELEGLPTYEQIIRPYQIDRLENLPDLTPHIPNSEGRLFADVCSLTHQARRMDNRNDITLHLRDAEETALQTFWKDSAQFITAIRRGNKNRYFTKRWVIIIIQYDPLQLPTSLFTINSFPQKRCQGFNNAK